jgi:hypothetical protein
MSGSYRQCVECGKRALSFATRCPGCGIALPNPAPFGADATSQLSWRHSLKGGMTVVAIGVAIGIAIMSLERAASSPAPLNAETSFVAGEATPVTTPRFDTTTVAATTAIAGSAASAAGVPLIAKGWTHVRSRRTVNATLEAVLTPGDTVLADSLAKGWYRVALDGEVLGYARQSTLAPTQP